MSTSKNLNSSVLGSAWTLINLPETSIVSIDRVAPLLNGEVPPPPEKKLNFVSLKRHLVLHFEGTFEQKSHFNSASKGVNR